jgi:hypothetical protein
MYIICHLIRAHSQGSWCAHIQSYMKNINEHLGVCPILFLRSKGERVFPITQLLAWFTLSLLFWKFALFCHVFLSGDANIVVLS